MIKIKVTEVSKGTIREINIANNFFNSKNVINLADRKKKTGPPVETGRPLRLLDMRLFN